MDIEVLVTGAGPTGLTLAIELARRGVGVRIVDKAGTYFAGSRGDGLQPRTLEVFEDLGVLDAVLAEGAPQAPVRAYLDGEFAEERRMSPVLEPTPDVPYPNGWVLGQSRTEHILRERLAGLGVRVELGTELTGLSQDERGVTATLAHGGGERTVRCRYLVGADGGSSFVRKSLGVGFPGDTDESVRMLLGDVRADGLDHGYGHWFARAEDPAAGVVLTPLPGGDWFQFAAPLGGSDAGTGLDTLRKLLDGVRAPAGVRLRDLTWATVWRPNARLAERFRVGRVFLAGDAAHVHPPTGGQGLNTGVQDAYNLGWKLAEGSPALLDSYESERLPVAAGVLGLSERLLRKYTSGAPDAHYRGADTRQLDISYREDEGDGLLPGDRAPDAPVLGVTGSLRLFDLFRGPHATRLTFGAPCPGPEPGVHSYVVLPPGCSAGEDSVVDTGNHAHAAYQATRGTTVLIRPDGYLAGRGGGERRSE
ncbi:FAD-dependent monooxygenase [Amycolatopsis cihanbeyliensis]|uniref:2-polyprenyl-6-methoxyphenol hydroxylase-like FAD-dependent oxidoreductase n=1 Tax=Amycolatopsis cihanbeyliensis TaxID=1128664 RepID=A0A542DNY3_AMYCI|nr:FAD-dependent monooxygenase [Amycolatopsis cihanbeyliensis]TQJ04812.1 2-polyprenyl-6-methoxyphenol hydroxylase-like FAD-dependent oxidoreductase [Amycolatopsis cihanbeyliensis]